MEEILKLMKQQEARHNAAMEKMKALLAAAMDKKTAPKKVTFHYRFEFFAKIFQGH